MSITDGIEYDEEILKQMSTKELTYQLLLHKMLERPLRPQQLDAAKLQNEVMANVKKIATDLRENGLEQFATVVDGCLADYLTAIEGGGI